MEEKLNRIEEKLSKAVRNRTPQDPEYKPNIKTGNGYSSGKQSDSLLSRAQLINQYTGENDVLPDDERIMNTQLLQKIQERAAIQDRIKLAIGKQAYNHDQDKLFMGELDIPQSGNEIALSRNSFFADLNKFNTVSKNARNINPLEQSMLYK